MNTETFIQKANIIHNNTYDYSKVNYIKSMEKVVIICPVHGEFEQTPNNHLNNKQKCPKCYGKIKLTTEIFIEKSEEIHGKFFDYTKTKYTNNKDKVIITCPIHGDFLQKAAHHLSGSGCKCCSIQKRAYDKKYSNSEFILKANNVHNYKYDYTKTIYELSTKKVIISCFEHGDFYQIPAAHLSGNGCPECGNKNSKNVEYIKLFLDNKKIEYILEKRFADCKNIKPLPFDFYIPSLNLCIEYDGEQHYKSISSWGGEEGLLYRQINDNIKNEYCKNNNINLIRISYNNDINEILSINFK